MGDEHGSKVLAPGYPCEEPSAAVGCAISRPAAACLREKPPTEADHRRQTHGSRQRRVRRR